MESFDGVIKYVVYTRDSFSVLCVNSKSKKNIKVVCSLSNPLEGMSIRLKGEYTYNKKYGETFNAEECMEITPTTEEGLRKYLGSGIIQNISKGFADAIVDCLGTETINILNNKDENALRKVKGLGKKRIQCLLEGWEREKDKRDVFIYLRSHFIGDALANNIYTKYGLLTKDMIEEDPYRLIYEIDRVGFVTADKIAKSFGIEDTDIRRITAAIKYNLDIYCEENGYTYVEIDLFTEKLINELGVDGDVISNAMKNSSEKGLIILDNNRLFPTKYYYAEINIATSLRQILNYENDLYLDFNYKKIELDLGITYNDEQIKAINTAVKKNLMILTGGPGTGKTTVLKGILKGLSDYNVSVALAAPTGRAAKRMTEVTQYTASTIHRMLGYKPDGTYSCDENNPLSFDVVIIDESSMINTSLMNSIVKALKPTTKLILIGDVDQLPCIGAGDVLNDLINSNVIPTVRLEQIYRQASESKIITNAHKVNKGEFPNIINDKTKDFFFMEAEEMDETIEEILLPLWQERLPKAYNCKPQDIQILVPKKIGGLGVININNKLQNAIINKSEKYISHNDCTYYINDKVIQLKNNYEKGVFNGDIGYIKNIFEDTIDIDYDGMIVTYGKNELNEIQLAYAMTIHKSQGSEYDINIILMTMEHYVMLNRNLLYTAITRSKNICILIGDKQAVRIAVNNNERVRRLTYLKERLQY